MMMIGSSVNYVRSGSMRNVPVTKAVEHLYATTAKFSGCVLLALRPAYSYPPRRHSKLNMLANLHGVWLEVRYDISFAVHELANALGSSCNRVGVFDQTKLCFFLVNEQGWPRSPHQLFCTALRLGQMKDILLYSKVRAEHVLMVPSNFPFIGSNGRNFFNALCLHAVGR
ncbi:hypothetical protein AVEN_231165-1 [Araneus ventricosus]|uniref:Uncharacterized protein n=1 Tax=Araneus ventricosus TaxID=182803 RepID=A0A4Y2UUD5_ARAVE|nr:hypothetical protein AVEN_231165-1 [Araneus ventricosus]